MHVLTNASCATLSQPRCIQRYLFDIEQKWLCIWWINQWVCCNVSTKYTKSYYAEVNKILFDFQFGFRRPHSTTLALIQFTVDIRNILDEGNHVISIFIDLTKAFDTVDHEIFLEQLDRCGIRGHANSFLRSYLSKRKQYNVINGVDTSKCDVKYGVPLGLVQCPLLFALYINDIYRAVEKDHIRLFTDDTALFSCVMQT